MTTDAPIRAPRRGAGDRHRRHEVRRRADDRRGELVDRAGSRSSATSGPSRTTRARRHGERHARRAEDQHGSACAASASGRPGRSTATGDGVAGQHPGVARVPAAAPAGRPDRAARSTATSTPRRWRWRRAGSGRPRAPNFCAMTVSTGVGGGSCSTASCSTASRATPATSVTSSSSPAVGAAGAVPRGASRPRRPGWRSRRSPGARRPSRPTRSCSAPAAGRAGGGVGLQRARPRPRGGRRRGGARVRGDVLPLGAGRARRARRMPYSAGRGSRRRGSATRAR